MSRAELDRVLAEEVADLEAQWARGEENTAPLHRNRPKGETSAVYNVRMPVARLAQLYELAEKAQTPASTLMRQWVIERLDQELAGEAPPNARMVVAVRAELDRIGLTPDLVASLRRLAASAE